MIESMGMEACRGQTWRASTSNSRPEMPVASQRSLSNFNLITHGFGGPAVLGMLNILQRLLSEAIQILDKDLIPPHHSSGANFSVSGGSSNGQHFQVTASSTGVYANGVIVHPPSHHHHHQQQYQQRSSYRSMHKRE